MAHNDLFYSGRNRALPVRCYDNNEIAFARPRGIIGAHLYAGKTAVPAAYVGTWKVKYRAGRFGPGHARPVAKLQPSDPTSPFIPLRRCNLHFPRTSGPRDKDELKAACATFAIERATSYVTFRESLIHFLCARCAGSILTWKYARAQMFPRNSVEFSPRVALESLS